MSEKREGPIKQTSFIQWSCGLLLQHSHTGMFSQDSGIIFVLFYLFIYFIFFPEFQKEFLKKIAQLPIHSLPNALLQSVSHQTCLLFKKLAEYCGKKKRSISTELHITLSPTSAKLSPSWEEHKLKSSIWAHREATRPWRVELLLSYSTGKPQGARFFPR